MARRCRESSGTPLDCDVWVGDDIAEPIGLLTTRGDDVDYAVNFLVLEWRHVRFT